MFLYPLSDGLRDLLFHRFSDELRRNPADTVKSGIDFALAYYSQKSEFSAMIHEFESLGQIDQRTEEEIRSNGYVLNTLQASLWCLLTTSMLSGMHPEGSQPWWRYRYRRGNLRRLRRIMVRRNIDSQRVERENSQVCGISKTCKGALSSMWERSACTKIRCRAFNDTEKIIILCNAFGRIDIWIDVKRVA